MLLTRLQCGARKPMYTQLMSACKACLAPQMRSALADKALRMMSNSLVARDNVASSMRQRSFLRRRQA
jgi:hypothetical protein